jgi:chromosome segregation ATPase
MSLLKETREEQRKFHARDLWRIYCNNLSSSEQANFKKQFRKAKGRCDNYDDPCNELEEELRDGGKVIKEYENAVEEARSTIDDTLDFINDSFEFLNNIFDTISTELDKIRDSNNEDAVARWDELLSKQFPDPLERHKMAVRYADATKQLMLSGFAKTGTFAEELLRRQGEWKTRGTLILKLKEKSKLLAIATLAFIGFIGGMYKAFIEDCVEEDEVW